MDLNADLSEKDAKFIAEIPEYQRLMKAAQDAADAAYLAAFLPFGRPSESA